MPGGPAPRASLTGPPAGRRTVGEHVGVPASRARRRGDARRRGPAAGRGPRADRRARDRTADDPLRRHAVPDNDGLPGGGLPHAIFPVVVLCRGTLAAAGRAGGLPGQLPATQAGRGPDPPPATGALLDVLTAIHHDDPNDVPVPTLASPAHHFPPRPGGRGGRLEVHVVGASPPGGPAGRQPVPRDRR